MLGPPSIPRREVPPDYRPGSDLEGKGNEYAGASVLGATLAPEALGVVREMQGVPIRQDEATIAELIYGVPLEVAELWSQLHAEALANYTYLRRINDPPLKRWLDALLEFGSESLEIVKKFILDILGGMKGRPEEFMSGLNQLVSDWARGRRDDAEIIAYLSKAGVDVEGLHECLSAIQGERLQSILQAQGNSITKN